MFPLLHTGRPWLAAYWLFPYPSTMGVWPQFRSPLIWDVFAVSTYLTVSLLFWYVGLVPDLASMRDRAKSKDWADYLWHVGNGLAWFSLTLATLRDRLSFTCWIVDPSGCLSALYREFRLRSVD